MTPTIEHLPPGSASQLPNLGRFQAVVDGHLGVCDYRLDGSVMHLTHTEVAPALEGRGIAAALVKAALDHAQSSGLKVNPLCSYVRHYMQRHPETAALRAALPT
ncbi:MAG: acetyltransferase [Methylibium sp. NZG]|nr:MAG: acetyltransferase [Methylibium sp. NZG]